MSEKLYKDLKPEGTIVNHTFVLTGCRPTKVVEVKNLWYAKIIFTEKG